MIQMYSATVATVALVLIGLHVSASTVDYNNPVRTAEEDEVISNGSSSSKFYAGYLKAYEDGEPEQFLYYWFVESASDPSSDPVVLWLNGGPGGSSLVGAISIIGPIKLGKDGISIVNRRFSHNQNANMLYIEGPVGVGNSYSKVSLNSTDDSTATANYFALKSFMQKFPLLASNPLYLTGSSYAGVYLPTLGVKLDEDPEFNLMGLAIENGSFDQNLQDGSKALKMYYYGLIGERQLGQISDACCKGAPPTRENCDFDRFYLNYKCVSTVSNMYGSLNSSGLNLYNIYNKKPDLALNGYRKLNLISSRLPSSECVDCRDFDYWKVQHWTPSWPQYKALLHIPQEFNELDGINYCKQYTLLPGGVASHIKRLISSKRNLTMLIYNGDTDLVCDFLGTRWFVQGLGRKELTDYEPWKFEGQMAGFVQQFDGLTFATVLGAGHIPSRNIPDVSFAIFNQFLRSNGSQNVDMKRVEWASTTSADRPSM